MRVTLSAAIHSKVQPDSNLRAYSGELLEGGTGFAFPLKLESPRLPEATAAFRRMRR